jgi:uncharacterized protein
MTASAPVARHAVQPRKRRFDFTEVPRHWFGGEPVPTHVVNGLTLIFPWGERFFVRSVKHYLDQIDDPLLREQVRGFFGQEGTHAREHERMFAILEAQGYELASFLELYERRSRRIERFFGPRMRLAVTAASEHFTAILGEHALSETLLESAHPVVRDLLSWHAAEEIEHKAVAFDVLQRVAPSYALRMAGLALATVLVGGWWITAARHLLRQENIPRGKLLRGLRRLAAERPVLRETFLRGIREYARRDFHPMDNDNLHLAARYLATAA